MLEAPLLSILEVFELVALSFLGLGMVWLMVRSLPATLEGRQKRIEGIVSGFDTRLTEIVEAGAAQRVQFQTIAQEVETYLGQIERKRASTAASASRIAGTQNPAPVSIDKMSRAEQISMARKRMGAA